MMRPTREQAWEILTEYTKSEALLQHALAVEAVMRHFAELAGEDPDPWGVIGLLHDLDYAETAEDFERHGVVTAELLADELDDEQIHAILAHAGKVERETVMDAALYAADPTTGFIVAAALVRPDKALANVELRSLRKRWKEKAFARGASREQMAACEEIGLERDEFLALALDAMQARSGDVGL